MWYNDMKIIAKRRGRTVRSGNAELRRYEDNLYVSGVGVIIMGVWNVIKPVMQLALGSGIYDSGLTVIEYPETTLGIVVSFIIIFLLLAVLGLHFFVGVNAVRAAKREKHKKGYVVGAVIMLIISVLGLAVYRSSITDLKKIDTTIASLLVDITAIYMFITMIRSAAKIKKLRKELEQG